MKFLIEINSLKNTPNFLVRAEALIEGKQLTFVKQQTVPKWHVTHARNPQLMLLDRVNSVIYEIFQEIAQELNIYPRDIVTKADESSASRSICRTCNNVGAVDCMDLIELIEKSGECVDTPSGMYFKRSQAETCECEYCKDTRYLSASGEPVQANEHSPGWKYCPYCSRKLSAVR